MPSDTLISALVTIGGGAISGGVTNAVAIWMLFHPYEPVRLGPFTLQGALPKNKARLAKAIGKTVGEKLLTPEDLARRLSAPAIREAYARALGGMLESLLRTERGSLQSLLGPATMGALDDALTPLGERIAGKLAAYTETPAFRERLAGWIERLRAEVGDRPLGDVLTAERREALRAKVNDWVRRLAEGDALEQTIRDFVARQFDALAHDDRPLLDRLPASLVGAVEQGIADYLPKALEALGNLLGDPDARREIQRALRNAFDGSIRELLLHERLFAKLVVTDKMLQRLVEGFERDGFERFTETIQEPALRGQVARAVNDAVVGFLRVPLRERLVRLGDERRDALAATLGDWAAGAARDDATRRVIGAAVDRLLESADRRTWNDLLRLVSPEQAARLGAELLASERGRAWVEDAVRALADALLTRPIGRPLDWLGESTAAELTTGIVEASWTWVERQIPEVVARLEVPEMVEQKVLGFSTQRMEEIVRGVTQRELTLIVRLGYVLGAMVGLMAFGVSVLLGRA